MARVFIFGMFGVILIGLITGGIIMIGGASRITQKMFKGKKEEKNES